MSAWRQYLVDDDDGQDKIEEIKRLRAVAAKRKGTKHGIQDKGYDRRIVPERQEGQRGVGRFAW
jgi:hypothetical protein